MQMNKWIECVKISEREFEWIWCFYWVAFFDCLNCAYIYQEWCHHYAVKPKTYGVWWENEEPYLAIAAGFGDCVWNPPIMLSNLLLPVLKIWREKTIKTFVNHQFGLIERPKWKNHSAILAYQMSEQKLIFCIQPNVVQSEMSMSTMDKFVLFLYNCPGYACTWLL